VPDGRTSLALVSEDPSSLGDIVEELYELGFEVRVARWRELEALLDDEAPALIVLDGRDQDPGAIEQIAALRERTGVPFIVVGSRPEPRARAHLLELGAEDAVTYPFSPEQLALRMRGILRRLAEQSGSGGQ
jgi:DNA-binding response OmpR family regulator